MPPQRHVPDGANAPVTDVVERVTGRAPRSFAQYAAEHAGVWRPLKKSN